MKIYCDLYCKSGHYKTKDSINSNGECKICRNEENGNIFRKKRAWNIENKKNLKGSKFVVPLYCNKGHYKTFNSMYWPKGDCKICSREGKQKHKHDASNYHGNRYFVPLYCKNGHYRTKETVASNLNCKLCRRVNDKLVISSKYISALYCRKGHYQTALTKVNGKCKICETETLLLRAKRNRGSRSYMLLYCQNGHRRNINNMGKYNQCLICASNHNKKLISELDDSYVIRQFTQKSNLEHADIPKEVIDLKRDYLKLRREVKQWKTSRQSTI